MTIHARVVAARRRLREAGIPPDEADLDARLLAEHVLGWTTERYFADANVPEPPPFERRYDALVARRAAREPFAYIVGRQEFWGLPFAVTSAVLIPRPETEVVVQIALELFPGDDALSVCDVGTGSGCIAVAIAHERPRARIIAVDASAAALAVARRNAECHGVADRVEFRHADLLDEVGSFDLIVSNPPYVAERDRPAIQAEVGRYEPQRALFAGEDGLDVIRRLIADAPDHLSLGAFVAFEFGFGQADEVANLISRATRLRMVDLRRDLQDIPRVAVAQRV